jgi:hypothetical protein
MREQTAELIYGLVGQTLKLVPPEWSEGVPSALALSVWPGSTGNDQTADWTATPTVDTVSATVATASGASQTYRNRAYVAVAGIVVGKTYRIANGAGQAELVRVKNIVSASAYVELDADLLYDYAVTTSTFAGIELSATVDPTWVADDANLLSPGVDSYRCLWTYTINSIVRKHWTYARLVRQRWQSIISLADLRDFEPDIAYSEPPDLRGEACARLIAAAESVVRVDILAAGYKPESIQDTEILRMLLIEQARLIAARRGNPPPGRDPEAFVVEQAARYQSLLDRTIQVGLAVPVAQNSTGATTADPYVQPFLVR